MPIHRDLKPISTLILAIILIYAAGPQANSNEPSGTSENCEQALSQLPDIKPVIARTREQPFDDPDYLFEMKYDGFRGIGYFEKDRGCRFVSRQGNPLTQFQKLCEAIGKQLKVENAIFDGEVIAYDESNRPIFNNLQRRKGPFRYVAFDLMWLNGEDLRGLPLKERRRLMLKILPKRSPFITESLAMVGNGIRMFELMTEYDLEGIVAKRLHSHYTRSARWYKIKNRGYSQGIGRGRFVKHK